LSLLSNPTFAPEWPCRRHLQIEKEVLDLIYITQWHSQDICTQKKTGDSLAAMHYECPQRAKKVIFTTCIQDFKKHGKF
jgi:hypothetical protein